MNADTRRKLISKINAKQVGGALVPDVVVVKDANGKDVSTLFFKSRPLFKVAAVVHGYQMKPSTYADYADFRGQFVAVNSQTGELFESSRLLMPSMIEGFLIAAFDSAGGQHIETAFEVGIEHNEKSATKYVYTFTPLVEAAVTSPMAAMLQCIGIDASKIIQNLPKAIEQGSLPLEPEAVATPEPEEVATSEPEAPPKTEAKKTAKK